MPRIYIRKTNKAAYSTEQLKDAIRLVKNGTFTAYAASVRYGIPRPTIYERRGCKSNTLGRATILSREVEESPVNNLHVLKKYGFGLTRKEILEAVGTYIKVNRIESPFKDGVPGEDWFLGFKPCKVEAMKAMQSRGDLLLNYYTYTLLLVLEICCPFC